MSKYLEDEYTPLAVRSAYEVVALWEENQRLRDQVAELQKYRQKYHDEINASIKHSQHMIGGMLELVLTKDITDKVPA